MSRKVLIILSFIIVSIQTGCLYFRSHPLSAEPSAKEIQFDRFEILGEAEGTSSSFNLMHFIPVTNRVDFNEAITEAIRSKGGDNLVEFTAWRERKVYIIGSVEILHVRGKVLRYITN